MSINKKEENFLKRNKWTMQKVQQNKRNVLRNCVATHQSPIVIWRGFCCLFVWHHCKTHWQQRSQRCNEHSGRFRFCYIKWNIIFAKFAYKLTTNATRCCKRPFLVSNYGECFKSSMARTNCLANCSSFSANCWTVRWIFNITSSDNWIIGNTNRWTHLKIAVWTTEWSDKWKRKYT